VKHSDLGESALSAPSRMNVEPTHELDWLGATDVAAGPGSVAVGLAGLAAGDVVADPLVFALPPRGDTSTGPQPVVAAAATRISTSRRAVRWYMVKPPSSINPSTC
jgi:hypothetical protein